MDLVLKALVASRADHAIIRSGRVPLIVRGTYPYRISDSTVPRATVAKIAEYLLPDAELRALDEIGETRYHLPHERGSCEDFVVDVVDQGGDLCVDIEHHGVPPADEIPAEVFQSRLDC